MSEYSNSSKETMRVGSRAKSTRSRKSTKGKPDLDSCSTNAGILCESTNKYIMKSFLKALDHSLNNLSYENESPQQRYKILSSAFRCCSKLPNETLTILLKYNSRANHTFWAIPPLLIQGSKKSKGSKGVKNMGNYEGKENITIQCRPIFRLFSCVIEHQYQSDLVLHEAITSFFDNLIITLDRNSAVLNISEFALIVQFVYSIIKQMIEDRKLSDQRWKQLNVIMNLLMVQRNSVREHEQFVLLSQCVSVVINGLISSMRLLYIPEQYGQMFIKLFKTAFEFEVKVNAPYTTIYVKFPLFNLAILAIFSKNRNVTKYLMKWVQSTFKACLSENDIQANPSHELHVNKDHKIKIILICSYILNFQSSYTSSNNINSQISHQILLLVILYNRYFMLQMITYLYKLVVSDLPKGIAYNMFKIAQFCNLIYRYPTLYPIVSKIVSFPAYLYDLYEAINLPYNNPLHYFKNVRVKEEDEVEYEPKLSEKDLGMLVNTVYNILFLILRKIQKSIPLFPLDEYMKCYIADPMVFYSEYFINNLFYSQYKLRVKDLMVGMTEEWIRAPIKCFDFTYYLTCFFEVCLKLDMIDVIGKYVKELTATSLLAISQLFYRNSFNEEQRKSFLPELVDDESRFASITSVGFASKSLTLDIIMPNYAEQFMWKYITHNFFNNKFLYIVKAFYNTFHYELTTNYKITIIRDTICEIVMSFGNYIATRYMDSTYSVFQLITCLLVGKDVEEEEWLVLKQKLSGIVLNTILTNADVVINLYDIVSEGRRSLMATMEFNYQTVKDNMYSLEKSQRMHTAFLKNIVKFVYSISNAHQLIPKNIPFEIAIYVINRIAQRVDTVCYHFMRVLSYVSSNKLFHGLVHKKLGKAPFTVDYLYLLRELTYGMTKHYPLYNQYKRYRSNRYGNDLRTLLMVIINVLSKYIEPSCEKYLLKCKIIALDIYKTMKRFIKVEKNSKIGYLKHFFNYLFQLRLKRILLEYVYQNPIYVSKYYRELIIHLRMIVLDDVFEEFGEEYAIVSEEETLVICLYLCLDKSLYIRMFIINLLISRFKSGKYHKLHAYKCTVLAIMTIVSFYYPEPPLKYLTKIFVSEHRSVDNVFLALLVLLISLKLMLSLTMHKIEVNEYNLSLDQFLIKFDKIWQIKKELYGIIFAFCGIMLYYRQYELKLIEFSSRTHMHLYHMTKYNSDFGIESQMRSHMKVQVDLYNSYDDYKGKLRNMMYCLERRAYEKIRNIIVNKTRGNRTLKMRKDVVVHWYQFVKKNVLSKMDKERKYNIKFYLGL